MKRFTAAVCQVQCVNLKYASKKYKNISCAELSYQNSAAEN